MSFSVFNFRTEINKKLEELKFETPTPIQSEAIPVVVSGKDVMGLAQTGTGKTAAFVLPMVERLSKTRSRDVRAVIIAPTRELASQIHEVVATFGEPLGLRSMTAFGGVSMQRQIQELRRGVDIVVACPGRLLDHIEHKNISLGKIEMVVLDEADQMFDMGFIPDIRAIFRYLPKARQTLMFSATMPPDIRRLAEQVLSNPITIRAGSPAPVATVTHALYPVDRHLKSRLVLELLKHADTDSVLIFVRTKHGAKRLADQIKYRGFKVTSLQGNLRQNQRDRAMAGFRDGSYQIMVATDIAARGLDIASISHVINYDMPDTVEAYTHRIGRTGRAARTGDAFTLVGPEDFAMIRDIEEALGYKLERRKLDSFNYKANHMDIVREDFEIEKAAPSAPEILGEESDEQQQNGSGPQDNNRREHAPRRGGGGGRSFRGRNGRSGGPRGRGGRPGNRRSGGGRGHARNNDRRDNQEQQSSPGNYHNQGRNRGTQW